MEEKLAWMQFLKTGKIEDYLKYRQLHNKLEMSREFNYEKRENKNQGDCLKNQ